MYGSSSGSFPFLMKVLRGLKQCLQKRILTQNFSKEIKFLILKIMCLRASFKKNFLFFFASFKSLKKVGSGVGSGSVFQRCGSADMDPHQNATDPQHCSQDYKLICLFTTLPKFLFWSSYIRCAASLASSKLKNKTKFYKCSKIRCTTFVSTVLFCLPYRVWLFLW